MNSGVRLLVELWIAVSKPVLEENLVSKRRYCSDMKYLQKGVLNLQKIEKKEKNVLDLISKSRNHNWNQMLFFPASSVTLTRTFVDAKQGVSLFRRIFNIR